MHHRVTGTLKFTMYTPCNCNVIFTNIYLLTRFKSTCSKARLMSLAVSNSTAGWQHQAESTWLDFRAHRNTRIFSEKISAALFPASSNAAITEQVRCEQMHYFTYFSRWEHKLQWYLEFQLSDLEML